MEVLLDSVDFQTVQAPEINNDEKDLSCNQKCHSIFKAVRSSFVFAHQTLQKPELVNHAWWLTAAYRILQL